MLDQISAFDRLLGLARVATQIVERLVTNFPDKESKTAFLALRKSFVQFRKRTESAKQGRFDIREILQAAHEFSQHLDSITIHLIDFLELDGDARKARSLSSQFQMTLAAIGEDSDDARSAVAELYNNDFRQLADQLNVIKGRVIETERTFQAQEQKSLRMEELLLRLETNLAGLEALASESVQNAKKKFSDTLAHLDQKQAEVDEVVGIIAAKSIVGSYEKSAETEEDSAESLRQLAVALMLVVMIFVGWTFYEITTSDFSWEKTLLKLICSLLFSVPAAYLARESAKHRQQQYTHLQTALDIKAIGPYIASLDKKVQDELKLEIAKKIFAPKTFSHVTKESYPINAQELILAALDKIKPGDDAKGKS